MNASETITNLLRDAEHIAKANNFVILAYLIGMALEHIYDEVKPSKTAAG
jgi:hypothetical protein